MCRTLWRWDNIEKSLSTTIGVFTSSIESSLWRVQVKKKPKKPNQRLKIEEWNEVYVEVESTSVWILPEFYQTLGQEFGYQSIEVQWRKKGGSTFGWPLVMCSVTEDHRLEEKLCQSWFRLPLAQEFDNWSQKLWRRRVEAAGLDRDINHMFGNWQCVQRDYENRSRSLGVNSKLVKFGKIVWHAFGRASVAEADVIWLKWLFGWRSIDFLAIKRFGQV